MLARTLALRLTNGLTDGAIATLCDAQQDPKHSAASVGWGTGEVKIRQWPECFVHPYQTLCLREG